MQNIDPNDTMIPAYIIMAINETAHDLLIASRDMSHESRSNYKKAHSIALITNAHQIVLALEIDVYVGVINIQELSHLYAKC